MIKLSSIEKFPNANYHVNVSWGYLKTWLEEQSKYGGKLEINPPFQRGYVWTEEQKVAYIEYILRGGMSGRDIHWNAKCYSKWSDKPSDMDMVLVDGKQRLTAVLDFIDGKIKAFGYYIDEFEDKKMIMMGSAPYGNTFNFHINELQTDEEIVKWYLAFNTGGSIHTQEDLKVAYDYLNSIKNS